MQKDTLTVNVINLNDKEAVEEEEESEAKSCKQEENTLQNSKKLMNGFLDPNEFQIGCLRSKVTKVLALFKIFRN